MFAVHPHPFLPGMGGGPGQLPYHLQCPHPPPAHLHYYYDPSCFVRVAPPHGGEELKAAPSDTKTQSVIDISEASDVCTRELTTKKETCTEPSESDSGSAIVNADTTDEVVHLSTKSEKVETVSSGETVDRLETRPKTEVEPTNVSPSMNTEVEPTNVSPSMNTEVEPTNVSPSMMTEVEPTNVSPSMSTEVEPTNVSMKTEVVNEVAKSEPAECKRHCDVEVVSCNDKAERTSGTESPKTSAALGGLHALYEASLHVHREAPKPRAVEEDVTDGLQLLCSAMERAMETSRERGGSDRDVTSDSPRPIAGTTASPDLDKNYNVPRKGSFTPMKGNPLRKDETREWRSPAGERCRKGEWRSPAGERCRKGESCRSPLKIGEQL